MQLASTLVSGALMAMIGTAGSQMMVEQYKGSAKAQLRSQADTAFRLVQKYLEDGNTPTTANGCTVDEIGAYGAVEPYAQEVTISCQKGESGNLEVTQTRLVAS